MPFSIRPFPLLPVRHKANTYHAGLMFRRVLSFILITLCLSFTTFQAKARGAETNTTNCDTQTEGQWAWVDRSGKNRTHEELQNILKQHQTWFDTAKKEGKQADLSGTKLKRADLHSVNLSEANLTDSDLSYTDLTRAILNQTNLRGTNLQCARLNETYLQGADLTNVDLSRTIISSKSNFAGTILVRASLKGQILHDINFSSADLTEADLSATNLTNMAFTDVNFRDANLRGALLVHTNMSVAHLEGADLFGATYEVDTHPKTSSIAYAKNIEYMTYESDPSSLAHLRAEFKVAGFRDQERKITFALKSRQVETLWETCENAKGNCFEYFVNRYLFDLTSQYGMNPGRVLLTILTIFGVSTVLYWGLIHFSKDSGLSINVPLDHDRTNQPLWLKADLSKDGQLIRESGVETKKGYKVLPRQLHQFKNLAYCREWMRRERALLWVSFVFSLMSTFNIKFRDVDFGRWLKQLTTREYEIKAVGFARTVSGIQALLSVYFIALLLVTYFGRPFE
ncbi:MAG: pentapeptide repeat-containing protein [Nitrospira sp.]